MTDLADFLRARFAERREQIKDHDGSYNDADGCWGLHEDPAAILADLDAKLRMLQDADEYCAEYDAEIDDDNSAAQRAHHWRLTIWRNLAAPYVDHPGYRQGWAVPVA